MTIENLETLQEFIPNGSYSFGAVETYRSDIFHFRTGPNISVLEIWYAEKYNIMLYGEHTVSSDYECWQIVLKFRQNQLSDIVLMMRDEISKVSHELGQKVVRDEIKQALFGKYVNI